MSSSTEHRLREVCAYLKIHLLLVQREHTQLLLSQLTLHLAPRCERLASELDRFNKHVQLNNAKFVPGGVFTLSRPLIVTVCEPPLR